MKINKNLLLKQIEQINSTIKQLLDHGLLTVVDLDKIYRGEHLTRDVINRVCEFLDCNQVDIIDCTIAKKSKVNWELEEACVLFYVFFKYSSSKTILDDVYEHISTMLRHRASELGFVVDEKFRNITGIKMQMKCVEYVATDGKSGLSNASKVFYEAFDLYNQNKPLFDEYVNQMYKNYGE